LSVKVARVPLKGVLLSMVMSETVGVSTRGETVMVLAAWAKVPRLSVRRMLAVKMPGAFQERAARTSKPPPALAVTVAVAVVPSL
jgi:hypothetical protein